MGAERGFTLALSADVAAPLLASDYKLYVFSYNATDYVPMPWGHHHALALHGASAVTMGNYPYQGLFYVGGFLEAPLFQNYTLGAYQGPFVLRGYPAFSIAGNQYHLFNAEYRFPIVDVDRATPRCRFSWGASAVTSSPTTVAHSISSMPKIGPTSFTSAWEVSLGRPHLGLLPIRPVSLRLRTPPEGSPRGARRAELRRHLCAVLRLRFRNKFGQLGGRAATSFAVMREVLGRLSRCGLCSRCFAWPYGDAWAISRRFNGCRTRPMTSPPRPASVAWMWRSNG